MPRIAAAVGGFVLIAFSIGFNIARYPVVWEMVGASPQLSRSGKSSQLEASVESTGSWQSTPVDSPADDSDSKYFHQDSSAQYDSADAYSYSYEDASAQGDSGDEYSYQDPYSYQDSSADWDDGQRDSAHHEGDCRSWETGYAGSEPVADTEEDGQDHGDTYSYAAQSPVEVEPSSRYAASAEPAGTFSGPSSGRRLVRVVRPGARQDPTGHSDTGREVRRLPPVDQVSSATADRYAPRRPEGQIPVYPTTGVW